MNSSRRRNTAALAAAALVVAALAAFAEDAPPPAEPAAPAKAESAACGDPEPGKLAGCAQPLAELAAAYEDARRKTADFAAERSAGLAELFKKEAELKATIEKNSADVTKLKFESGKDSKRRVKELEKENKGLWKELKGMEGQKARACKELRKAVSRHASEQAKAVDQALQAALEKMQ